MRTIFIVLHLMFVFFITIFFFQLVHYFYRMWWIPMLKTDVNTQQMQIIWWGRIEKSSWSGFKTIFYGNALIWLEIDHYKMEFDSTERILHSHRISFTLKFEQILISNCFQNMPQTDSSSDAPIDASMFCYRHLNFVIWILVNSQSCLGSCMHINTFQWIQISNLMQLLVICGLIAVVCIIYPLNCSR